MNIKRIITSGILGLAALVLTARPASALSYASGDVLVGFRATSGNTSVAYLLNLGNVSQFTSGNSVTLSLGDVGSDLTSLFGSNWNTSAEVLWSAFAASGSTGSNAVLYATHERTDPGIVSDAWGSITNSNARGNVRTEVNAAGLAYKNSGPSGPLSSFVPSSPVGGVQSSTYGSGYVSQVSGSPDFGSSSVWSNVEGSFDNGTSGSVLDFFSSGSEANTNYYGYFTISNAGVISFTAVPEPSVYALLGLAGIVAVVVYKRRRAIA